MNYAQAIQFLYELQVFGAKPGLESTLRLAERAGHPHHRLRFVHVAGTNGKGSTCAMLESIYRAAGLRVGLYTSPHLVSFRERIQVNRQLIPQDDVVRLVERAQRWVGDFPEQSHPTFFEVVTVIALCYFAEQKCDLVILETGLGGRLDATNIVTPLASVITNVQFDHENWLGDTLEKIAREKAGIIKPRAPVITAACGEALGEIATVAEALRAPWHHVDAASSLEAIRLPLPGSHQCLNAALALRTVEVLRSAIPVSGDQIKHGLETVQWPGRFQIVQRANQTVVLDGAHNPAGAEALREALREQFPHRELTLMLGVLQDKNWVAICHTLAPLAAKVFTVPVASERTALAQSLATACHEANPAAAVVACGSFAEALKLAEEDAVVVIAGSLYLVGEALQTLHLATNAGADEKGLNDWHAKR